MDLGIAGRSALVCASSQGLGRACAQALLEEGVDVVINGRDPDKLTLVAKQMAADMGPTAGSVRTVAADLTTEEGRRAFLDADPEPDILILNNAGPAPGRLAEVTPAQLGYALEAHYLAPIALLQATVPGMRARRFGRVVTVTSAMVTTPRPSMLASAGARAGLTAVLKAVALDAAPDGVTLNNLLPERIDSPRQLQMAQVEMDLQGITFDEARGQQVSSIAAKRLGRPAEFGATCAFLCSVHAGFISGMNIHLDGGSYPGLV